MTLEELKIIKSAINLNRWVTFSSRYDKLLTQANKIIDREIKLKTLNPTTGQYTETR